MESNSEFSWAGKVEKFDGRFAVIDLGENQRLNWPIKNLPEEIGVGSEVRLSLSTAKTVEEEREKIAKTILNRILKTKDNDEGKKS